MTTNIESLSYEELLELQQVIKRRLVYLESLDTTREEYFFKPGDEVFFAHPSLGMQSGTLLKYNEKTVTISTQSGQRWEVTPHLLRKKIVSSKNNMQRAKIISLPKKP